MYRDRQPRVTTAFPVRIWGLDVNCRPFAQIASVTNVSDGGILLNGVRHRLRAGEVIDVQYNDTKAEFLVVWAGQRGTTTEGELGLQALPSQPCLWEAYLDHATEFAAQG
jgi:hypothetical protein